MDQHKEITREELHHLVWSKPIRVVAKEFGLSDVSLAKICRKLGVRNPPRGFWAKVPSGMRIKKPPLGAPTEAYPPKRWNALDLRHRWCDCLRGNKGLNRGSG